MPKLSKITLVLTLGYFLFWVSGPLLFGDLYFHDSLWLGLPIWFWLSCLLGPTLLLILLFYLTFRRVL